MLFDIACLFHYEGEYDMPKMTYKDLCNKYKGHQTFDWCDDLRFIQATNSANIISVNERGSLVIEEKNNPEVCVVVCKFGTDFETIDKIMSILMERNNNAD